MNENHILIGTKEVGIIGSLDGGASWSVLPHSSIIPKITSIFFDRIQNVVIGSSYGRGLWKLDLTPRPTTFSFTNTGIIFGGISQVSGILRDSDSGEPVADAEVSIAIASESLQGGNRHFWQCRL